MGDRKMFFQVRGLESDDLVKGVASIPRRASDRVTRERKPMGIDVALQRGR